MQDQQTLAAERATPPKAGRPFWRPPLDILTAAAATTTTASIGASITTLGPWYRALKTPPWQPPDFAFPIAWTLIFALATAAIVLGWRTARSPGRRALLVGLFLANGAANVGWSYLFFNLQRPDWALWEVGLLFASIAALMAVLWPRTRLGALLLAPYLAWVAVAALLNWEVVRLNGPFG